MGWKIPEIKIQVPEVRAPKAPAGRAMPKPRAARKPAAEKMGWFSLTVFSSNKAPKWIQQIDVIKALIVSDGNRRGAAKSLKVTCGTVSRHAKNIRNLPDAQLRRYADELGVSVSEIRRICADFGPKKGITHTDIIRALLACGGNRKIAAQSLRIKSGAVSQHAKNIRQLSDADLKRYSSGLKTTVDEIKRVCADFDASKGITHIDIIREMLASGGNRSDAAQNLGIDKSVVGQHAKNIRHLPDADLQKYADKLSEESRTKITVRDIREVVAPRGVSKINFERRIQIIKELLASGGDRVAAARNLGIAATNISHHAKNIRRMPDIDLQIYATRLKTTVSEIKRVCADFDAAKGITHIDIIRELLACDGNRKSASQNLKIADSSVSWHAKNIRRMPDADLQKYADKLKTTVDEIKRVCADFDPAKGITHIDVIRELLASDGNRTTAARSLNINSSAVRWHAKNIRGLPDADLKRCANELKTTIGEIKRVCADFDTAKGITHADIIRELLASGGNRTTAARSLKIYSSGVGYHAKKIRTLPDAELQIYANKFKTTVSEIRRICADLNPRKGVTHSDVMRELLTSGGSRAAAARNLGVSSPTVSMCAQNIMRSPEAKLAQYAVELGVSVERIREVCAPRLEQAKKLFEK